MIRFLVLEPGFPARDPLLRRPLPRVAPGDRRGDDDEYGSEAERLLGRLDSELRYIDVGEIFERGLLPFLDGIQTTCHRVGHEIQRTFFLDLKSCFSASSTKPS